MSAAVPPLIDYAAIKSVSTAAGCFDCKETWQGSESRDKAKAHARDALHSIWIEGAPVEGTE